MAETGLGEAVDMIQRRRNRPVIRLKIIARTAIGVRAGSGLVSRRRAQTPAPARVPRLSHALGQNPHESAGRPGGFAGRPVGIGPSRE